MNIHTLHLIDDRKKGKKGKKGKKRERGKIGLVCLQFLKAVFCFEKHGEQEKHRELV